MNGRHQEQIKTPKVYPVYSMNLVQQNSLVAVKLLQSEPQGWVHVTSSFHFQPATCFPIGITPPDKTRKLTSD